MSEDRFDADGNPCTYGDDTEPAEPPFDLTTHALPGWYASPDDSPSPWYWDGSAWVDPAGRLEEMLCQLTADRIYLIAERAHTGYEKRIQRKYFWHLFKNLIGKA